MTLVDRFDERHDALWTRIAAHYPTAVVRDASFLNWKYVTQPGQDFVRMHFVRDGGIVAIAVLQIREAGGAYSYRRGFIADLVMAPDDSRLAATVLEACRSACRERGCATLTMLLLHGGIERQLRRFGFVRREPERYLLVAAGGLSSDDEQALVAPRNWLLTMGDSDIDRPGQS
jgi:hypothetical protein